MFLNIDGNYFLNLKGINHILNHKEEVTDVVVEDELIKGNIILTIDYFTNVDDDFKSQSFPVEFEIIKEASHEFKGIEISHFDFNVIDNNGLDINYQLKLEIIKHNKVKSKKNDVQDELNNEEFKDLISEEIDSKLEKALETREEVIVRDEEIEEEIFKQENKLKTNQERTNDSNSKLEKKSEETNIEVEKKFEERNIELENKKEKNINIINQESDERFNIAFEDGYSSYKIIYPEKEADLEVVSKRYNKPIDKIYKDSNYNVGDVIIIKND